MGLTAGFASSVGKAVIAGLTISMAASYSFASKACPLMYWRVPLYMAGLAGLLIIKRKIDRQAEPLVSTSQVFQKRLMKMNMVTLFVVVLLLVGGC